MLFGTPASYNKLTAKCAIIGVCSAGLARTALPAERAPEICPVKIAKGKFQGEMHVIIPLATLLSS